MTGPGMRSLSGREARREQARAERRAAGSRAGGGKRRRKGIHPVTAATLRASIEADMRRLVTAAGLQCYLGTDADRVANLFGRVVYVVLHAARAHGLEDEPDARIVVGSANALADAVETPAQLDQHRAAITSGLAAAQRLLPRLDTWALADGALELDALLSQGSLGTADVRRLVGMEG